jgi:alpha-tubulin suppressor-like RCC1 family protein
VVLPEEMNKMIEICGTDHCLQLSRDTGKAFTYALHKTGNKFGQLCRSAISKDEIMSVHEVISTVDFSSGDVSSGRKVGECGHTVLLSTDGDIYTGGCDRWYQLGQGELWARRGIATTELGMALVPKDTRFIGVSAGADHTLAVTNTGDVYACGKGGDGQLGVERPFAQSSFKKSKLLSHPNAIRVDAEVDCSTSLDSSGNVLRSCGRCPPHILAILEKRSKG